MAGCDGGGDKCTPTVFRFAGSSPDNVNKTTVSPARVLARLAWLHCFRMLWAAFSVLDRRLLQLKAVHPALLALRAMQ
jgi:hypothetical protein